MRDKNQYRKETLRTACALALLSALLLSGCTHHTRYRTNLTASPTTPEGIPQDETATIEDGGSYILGFVEFDDQGWLWSRAQLDAVMDRLREEEHKQRLVIVAFVHGWKHNARSDDSHVEMVRQKLRTLHR